MKFNQKVFSSVAGGALLACSVMAGHADIKYTQQTTIGSDPKAAGASTMTRLVQDGAERTEMEMNLGQFKMNYITLHICEPKQDIKLDAENKMYTVVTPYDPAKANQGAGGTVVEKDPTEPKTGKIVSTYSVQDLGEETIAGFKTRHYRVTTTLDRTGCIGTGSTTSTVEYWISDIKDATPCKVSATDVKNFEMPQFDPGCKVTYETKGDITAFQNIFKGLILKTKTYDGAKVLATMEVTQLSQAKLDNSLFKVPADYKKVSEEEFQKIQTAAMMKGMMTGKTPVG